MHYKTNIVFRFMWHECFKPFWGGVAVIFSSGVFWAFDVNFRPYLSKLMFDQLGSIKPEQALTELMPFIMLLFSSILARSAVFRLYDFVWYKVRPEMKLRINNVIMSNIMNRSHVFLQKNVSGSLSNQIQDLINNLPLFIDLIFNKCIAHVAAFFISLTLFWRVNTKFALVLITWAAFFILCSVLFATKAQKLSSKAARKQFLAFGEVVDVLHNVFRIKLFNTCKFESQRLDDYFAKFGQASKKRDYLMAIVSTIQTLSYALYQLACFLLLIYEYKCGRVTIGDFILIFSLNRDMIDYMWVLAEDISKFGDYYGTTKQVLNGTLTSYHPNAEFDLCSPNDDVTINKYEIKFENIDFRYSPKEDYIFQDLSLTIKDKQKVGIVGYSGAGKSTLINLLLRLCDQTEGVITLNGIDIKNIKLEKLRSIFSVITQDSTLLNRTIAENISYGKMDATQEEIEEAAKKAEAHEFIMNMPKGYETSVGQKGSNLSVGQRQRIAIACAILKNSPILVMDEATAALDSVTESKITKSLGELMKNKTAIIIAHKLATLTELDRIIVLNKGKIVQDGSHKELINQEGLYRDLVRAHRTVCEVKTIGE